MLENLIMVHFIEALSVTQMAMNIAEKLKMEQGTIGKADMPIEILELMKFIDLDTFQNQEIE